MSAGRKKRHQRIRNKISGTPWRPRLNVYRSLKNIYAQLIDDLAGETLVAASTQDSVIRDQIDYGGNVEAAEEVGKLIAERALEAGIEKVVFDRGGNNYHGRIKALAEAARENGLKF
ncbi:50S ribosomal protein L18 [Fuchsiella alkaliacetigena]|uniref:50S ribosomal protein L18 n=1 Tax=Fuchsiella alkaliacetigena TaxID=957042 RepID=UPI00200A942B|nr:50S ribosomal protein L18 [Fuchsiella alkaliacetigena]MCK8824363.1 50S ribosomal protein L18 [Fuchsiella alkaliacetigena]